MLSTDKYARLRDLSQKTTQGQWGTAGKSVTSGHPGKYTFYLANYIGSGNDLQARINAEFAAEAHNLMPELLNDLEVNNTQFEDAKQVWEHMFPDRPWEAGPEGQRISTMLTTMQFKIKKLEQQIYDLIDARSQASNR